ncbi:MAG: HNH endonuclease, partial [candidate division WOR-3 bacterium]
MKLRKYSVADLKEACRTSGSLRQVLNKLNVKAAGGNYETLKKAIEHYDIDISHFHGKGWNKGDHSGILKSHRRTLDEVLKDGVRVSSYRLKNRLIKAGIKEHKCEMCGITEWLGNKTPIELDHINGKRNDNRIENLRILCPNCHALTPTYRGKNKKTA